MTVACEPTGHRWRILGELSADRGMSFVCVQPTISSWARRSEDLTFDKTDDKDAVLIARLTGQLRCYLPEPVGETWGRLRHLGTRRAQLLEEHVACVQQLRDLLECVWPAVLTAAAQPFRSTTWVAALSVILRRDGGDLDRTRRLGPARFERLVRTEMVRRGKVRPCLRIVRKVYVALADRAGVLDHRAGALERAEWVLSDWDTARAQQVDVETRMVTVLDELELTAAVITIPGLSAVGAAAILAETGDLSRFTSARAVVKHAGLAPRERMSGTFTGTARLTGAGRPGAAHRGVAGGVGVSADEQGLRRPLPAPDHPGQEQAHADPGADHHRRRDPAPAARRRRPPSRLGPRPGHRDHQGTGAPRGRLTRERRARRPASPAGPGRAFRGIENHHRYLVCHQGPPRPVDPGRHRRRRPVHHP